MHRADDYRRSAGNLGKALTPGLSAFDQAAASFAASAASDAALTVLSSLVSAERPALPTLRSVLKRISARKGSASPGAARRL